jgi:hypothetical protein
MARRSGTSRNAASPGLPDRVLDNGRRAPARADAAEIELRTEERTDAEVDPGHDGSSAFGQGVVLSIVPN